MSLEQIFLSLLALASGVLGWLAREMFAAIKKLQEDMNHLEVNLGTNFIRYDRLQDMLRPLAEDLREIKAALQQKADK